MSRTLSRQELYDLVWDQPVNTVAASLSISDVALKKVCRKMDVPAPERGYWARKQAGQRVTTPSLPKRKPGMNDNVTIGGQRYSYYAYSEETLLKELPPAPTFPDDIDELRVDVRRQIRKVAVPQLTSAHRAISSLLVADEQRREKQRTSSYPSSFDAPLFDAPFERRRLKIANALFLALTRCGHRTSVDGKDAKSFSVTIGDQWVSFTLDVPGAPDRDDRHWGPRKEPTTKIMELKIGSARHPERSWKDEDGSRLENKLTEVAVEIVVQGELNHRASVLSGYEWQVKRKAEVEERLRREKAKREEEERQAKLAAEKARIDRLLSEATALRQAKDIREYASIALKHAAESGTADIEQVEAWARWANGEADRIDPLKNQAYLKAG